MPTSMDTRRCTDVFLAISPLQVYSIGGKRIVCRLVQHRSVGRRSTPVPRSRSWACSTRLQKQYVCVDMVMVMVHISSLLGDQGLSLAVVVRVLGMGT